MVTVVVPAVLAESPADPVVPVDAWDAQFWADTNRNSCGCSVCRVYDSDSDSDTTWEEDGDTIQIVTVRV